MGHGILVGTPCRARRWLLLAAAMLLMAGPTAVHAEAVRVVARPDYPVDFSSVVEDAMPMLVKIENESQAPPPKTVATLGKLAKAVNMKKGAGFFIDREGYILTNYHVVEGAERLNVIASNHKGYIAEMVGADPLTDLALIRIRPDFDVTPAVAGDSDRLKVGQPVLALGNPLGLEFIATAGIVSGFGPPGAKDMGCFDFIQLDVNIQPGDSGGPLLNLKGEVVGINSKNLGNSSGIGFAIPYNRAIDVARFLKKNGRISRGYLGVESQPMTASYARRLGLTYVKGALVSEVAEDSPAAFADIRQGDAIIEFDGRQVEDGRDLDRMVYLCQADTKVNLLVARGPDKLPVTATLSELASNVAEELTLAMRCRLTVKELTDDMALGMGLNESGGLVVVEVSPSCAAYTDGLRFGDVIKKFEGEEAGRPSDFYRAYSGLATGSCLVLAVERDGRQVLLTLKQTDEQ